MPTLVKEIIEDNREDYNHILQILEIVVKNITNYEVVSLCMEARSYNKITKKERKRADVKTLTISFLLDKLYARDNGRMFLQMSRNNFLQNHSEYSNLN